MENPYFRPKRNRTPNVWSKLSFPSTKIKYKFFCQTVTRPTGYFGKIQFRRIPTFHHLPFEQKSDEYFLAPSLFLPVACSKKSYRINLTQHFAQNAELRKEAESKGRSEQSPVRVSCLCTPTSVPRALPQSPKVKVFGLHSPLRRPFPRATWASFSDSCF